MNGLVPEFLREHEAESKPRITICHDVKPTEKPVHPEEENMIWLRLCATKIQRTGVSPIWKTPKSSKNAYPQQVTPLTQISFAGSQRKVSKTQRLSRVSWKQLKQTAREWSVFLNAQSPKFYQSQHGWGRGHPELYCSRLVGGLREEPYQCAASFERRPTLVVDDNRDCPETSLPRSACFPKPSSLPLGFTRKFTPDMTALFSTPKLWNVCLRFQELENSS